MVKEFTDELVNGAEHWQTSRNISAAREAGLPDGLVKRIALDSQIQPGTKKTLQLATPRVACKWLNKAGISAEYADELALVTGVGAWLFQMRKTQNLLQELIDQKHKADEKQNAKTNKTEAPKTDP